MKGTTQQHILIMGGQQADCSKQQHSIQSDMSQSAHNRLVGLVVKASASRAEDPGFESRLWWDFSRVESYQ